MSKKRTGKPKSPASRSGRAKRPDWMPDALVEAEQGAGSGERKSRSGAPGKRAKKPAPAPAKKASRRSAVVDRFAEREARRYKHPIASREAILAVVTQAEAPLSAEELAGHLGLLEEDRFEALSHRLAAMLRDGQLHVNRRGQYLAVRKTALLAGQVIANPDGFGFLHLDSGGEDLFLPPREMRKVFHGDRVLASVVNIDGRGRREGAIVEVLEHRLTRLVGRYDEHAGIGHVVPDDRRLQRNLMIPPDARLKARPGQLVVCEITEQPQPGRPPVGRILSVLGDELVPSLVVELAIHGHDLPHEFPDEVLDQAAALPLQVTAKAAGRRRDLRALPLVTIDGEDARDFDDAVWCKPDSKGFRLVVAIADVAHYVEAGGALDDEARHRGTSVYFPGFVIPMLPQVLSNGICSLQPGEDRLAMVCDMRVGLDGRVTRSRFYEAIIRSHARLTYAQVHAAIRGDEAEARAAVGDRLPQVRDLNRLYDALAAARAARGAIEFETSEVSFVLDADGDVIRGGVVERNEAHRLIEECMIAANVQAARFLERRKLPAPYRVHDRPPERKYADLQEFLVEFGLRMPPYERVEPADFTRLLEHVRSRPDAAVIESVLLRSQSLAVYSTGNIGHFGLALDAYAHFTSPIRRYADLLVHRAIKHALAGGKASDFRYAPHEMGALCLHCSERSRRAEEAEREVDERYRAAWMEQHVGSDFDGVVSSVTSFGLFVEIADSGVSGLVHVTQLPDDWYQFDAVRKVLQGERRGTSWRQGDTVRVRVLRASIEERRIDLRLLANEPAPARKRRGRKPA